MAVSCRAKERAHAENLFRLGRKPAAVLKSLKRLGLQVSRRAVFNWLKQFRKIGTLQERKAGSGRRRSIKGSLRTGLLRSSRRLGFSVRRWAKEHNRPRETVRQTLEAMGKVARVRRKNPMLTATNKCKRLEFTEKYQARSKRWWRRVTFTDSKYFGIGASGKLFAWVDRGEKAPPVPRPPREGPRVHVYGGLNVHGVSSPIILRKKELNVTAAVYCEKVLPHLVNFSRGSLGPRHIFMQDGAPAHTAAATVQWMDSCPSLGQRLAGGVWPPQSPDLNVIENFWSYITTQVQGHQPRTEKALVPDIKLEFRKVPAAFCKSLVESEPARLAQVIERAGAPTDY